MPQSLVWKRKQEGWLEYGCKRYGGFFTEATTSDGKFAQSKKYAILDNCRDQAYNTAEYMAESIKQ